MSRVSLRSPASPWLRALGLGAVLFGLGACPKPAPPPPPPPEDPGPTIPPLEAATTEIFEAWFAARPVYATNIGDHRYDGAWPKLAAADIEADLARINAGVQRLDGIDASSLTAEQTVDLDILRNELELQRFTHEVEQPWRKNPMWYARIIGDGLEDLVSRDYAPITERAQAAGSRLEGLPALVDQAIANLQPGETMAPHTEIAIGQLDGVLLLIDEIPTRIAGARPPDQARIEAAVGPAREAVERLRAHVETLLPDASAEWRLGKEAFERKLRLTLNTDLSADEVRRRAIFEHAQVRKQMEALAGELATALFSKSQRRMILRNADTDPETAIITAVLEELANDRVTPPRLRDQIEADLTRLDGFVRESGLVTLDDQEVLEVIWTPPHQRGVAIAGLAAPGPLDAAKPGLPSFYLVQPVPEDWPASYKESFLREYNKYMLEILSIHEAIPGHFVQLYYGKRDPSLIRKILANGPFVEGWAVYAERLVTDAGYTGAPSPETQPTTISKRQWKVMQIPKWRAKAIALHGLKFYLRTITNAILDHSIHAGTMDELGALELMVFRSFQQEGEAKAKWIRAQVTSTQLSTYFVGAQAWFELRKQAEAKAAEAGVEFDVRAFHDEALSHGAPPVHRLPELMTWAGDATEEPAAEAEPTVESDEPAAEADEEIVEEPAAEPTAKSESDTVNPIPGSAAVRP